jgi:hypothetical protein
VTGDVAVHFAYLADKGFLARTVHENHR